MPEINHRGYRLHVEGVPGAQATVRLEGRLALENLQPLMADLQAVPGRLKPRKIAVDLAGLEYLDSAGALALIEMENLSRSLGIPFELLGVSEKDHGLLCLIDREAMQRPPLRPESERLYIVVKLGELARRRLAQEPGAPPGDKIPDALSQLLVERAACNPIILGEEGTVTFLLVLLLIAVLRSSNQHFPPGFVLTGQN